MLSKRALGSTDLFVSAVGLGTVKFGRNTGVKYPQSFLLPSDKEISALLSYARELGINLLDTAPAYGESEIRLGQLLQGQRHDWLICGKVGEEYQDGQSFFDFSAAAIEATVARSLQRLKTDYLDILLLHSDGHDLEIIQQGTLEVLARLKEKGMIRALGMSTKTLEGGLAAVNHSDAVMVTYNPLASEEKPVIELAHQQKKGILIKKGLVSGHLNQLTNHDPIQACMDFIFKEAGVTTLILGTLQQRHLLQNTQAVMNALQQQD